MVKTYFSRTSLLTLILMSSIGSYAQQLNKPGTLTSVPNPVGTVAPKPADYSALANFKLNYVRTWDATGAYQTFSAMQAAGYQGARQTTQYLDGLGRPLQAVARQAGPGSTPKDLVAPSIYDPMGREAFKYLPYTQSNGTSGDNDGSFKMTAFTDQDYFFKNVYKDEANNLMYDNEKAFYNRTEFEPSPLNRVSQTFAPGNSWAGSYGATNPADQKAVKQYYFVNDASTDDVKIWDIESDPLAYDAGGDATTNIPQKRTDPYPTGTLYKSVTVDEQGNALVEYKDKEGKVILKKVQVGSIGANYSGYNGFLCTYYVYDDLGNLRFVIPPKAVEKLRIGNLWTLDETTIQELCFRYEYDKRQRMIAKKVPGSGWVYMIYDTRDRLVFTQDAKLRATNQWMVILYDVLNRPVLTGIMYYVATDPNDLQVDVTTITTTPLTNPNPGLQIDITLTTSNANSAVTAMRSITLDPGFESLTGGSGFETILNGGPGGEDGETSSVEGILVNKNPFPPGATFTALTKTYYDNYEWTDKTYLTTWNNKLTAGSDRHADAPPSVAATAVNGRTTGMKVRTLPDPSNLASGIWLTTVSFYDVKGRVIQTNANNHKNGTDIITTQFDFTSKPLITFQVSDQPGQAQLTVKTDITYDHAGRVLEIWKNINEGTANRIVRNTYDALGQLQRKDLGRKKAANGTYTEDPLEKLNYTYNIRGWVKGINKYYANKNATQETDRWFGMELAYDWGFQQSGLHQFNGNIEGIKWRSKGNDVLRAYGFSYDKANRLLGADFSQGLSTYADDANVNFDMVMGDGVSPTTAYDANGNILGMKQWGLKLTGSEVIDELIYTYGSNSLTNKLKSVVDKKNDVSTKLGDFKTNAGHPQAAAKTTYGTGGGGDVNSFVDYDYDANGNLTQDKNKNISSIVYNHLNLPWQITIKNDNTPDGEKGKITYVYDAAGNKLQKNVLEYVPGTAGSQSVKKTTITDYVTGRVFETLQSTETPAANYADKLQFVAQEEGRIRPVFGTGSASSQITGFEFDYMVKDHLGNVRAVLTEERKVDIYPAATLEGDINLTGSPNAVNEEKNYYTIEAGKIVTVTPSPSYTNENTAFVNPNPSSNTTATSQKMYEVKASPTKAGIGLGITLKVMAGDVIDITGRSYWTAPPSGSDVGITPAIQDLLTALLGSATGATAGSHATAPTLAGVTQVSGPLNSFLTDGGRNASGRPKAFINFIFFDDQFRYDNTVAGNAGFSAVSSTAGMKTDAAHFADLQGLTAKKNGYVYIYCSNESQVSVFFDNLQVRHTRSPLVEETHYYPFGLTMTGISSKALTFGDPLNKEETFQAQRFDDELDLDWVQFKWRNHDVQIGRFVELDPLAHDYVYNSPYAFSENKVIRHIELEGLETADSQDPRVRALMNDKVQQKMKSATSTLRNAAGVEVTAGGGVGVKAGVGPVKVEAGVSGPQVKVSVNLGGETTANASAASAGVKVGTPVGDAKAGVSVGNAKLENGQLTTSAVDGGASAKPSVSVSKGFSDEKTSGTVSGDSDGEISAGVKLGIGILVKLNPLNLLKGFAKVLDAATSYKVEEFKEKSANPMINRGVNRGPN